MPAFAVIGGLGHSHRDLAHSPPHFWIDHGRGRFLQHLLMTALNGTLAFAEIDRVAVLVRQHLHLDVPGIEDGLLEVNFAVAERPLRLALRRFQRRIATPRALCTRRMPLPPPPAAAFSITG